MAYPRIFRALHFLFMFLTGVKVLLASDCTPTSYSWVYMPVYDDVLLNDDVLSNYTGVSTRSECSAKCGIDSRCRSFFYNGENSICQTHTVVFLDPRGISSPGTKYFRKPTDCYIGSTVDPDARLFDSQGVSVSSGRMMMEACEPCRVQMEEITCLKQEHSVTMRACKRPSKCSEMKTLTNSNSDGEYWLYPPPFGGEKAKIYCHGMSTASPTEYVSLVTPNTGHYPALGTSGCQFDFYKESNQAGDTTFTKIRINTETMEVMRMDFQFAASSGHLNNYGEAGDCYKGYEKTRDCGPKGTFHINTVGTGMIVDQQVQWVKGGYLPWVGVSKSNDGLVVDLNCGGYCGWCSPDGPLVLLRYPSQEPEIATATGIACS